MTLGSHAIVENLRFSLFVFPMFSQFLCSVMNIEMNCVATAWPVKVPRVDLHVDERIGLLAVTVRDKL